MVWNRPGRPLGMGTPVVGNPFCCFALFAVGNRPVRPLVLVCLWLGTPMGADGRVWVRPILPIASGSHPKTRRLPRRGPPTGARPPKWTMHSNPPPPPAGGPAVVTPPGAHLPSPRVASTFPEPRAAGPVDLTSPGWTQLSTRTGIEGTMRTGPLVQEGFGRQKRRH